MNNGYAKKLAETISNEDILYMLKNAAKNVKDWTKPSKCNIGISRGGNWNMFCKDFDFNQEYHPIRKYRMIQEFGEFLHERFKQKTNPKKEQKKPTHFEPDLSNFI